MKKAGEGGPLDKQKQSKLLQVLSSTTGWASARVLADACGFTTRTVRAYVKQLNEASIDGAYIESSYLGYRLSSKDATRRAASEKSTEDIVQYSATGVDSSSSPRRDFLLRKLVGASVPISMYDLADQLYVSDSTFQPVLHAAREYIVPFNLSIVRHRDCVSLEGDERDKRRLIRKMILDSSPESLLSFASGSIDELGNSAVLLEEIREALMEADRSANDYGLINIAVHIVVMAHRIKSGEGLSEDCSLEGIDDSCITASRNLCDKVLRPKDVEVPETEAHWLALVVMLNSGSRNLTCNSGKPALKSLDEDDLNLARLVCADLSKTYCTDAFSTDFVNKLATHFHGLRGRAKAGSFAFNPLGKRTRENYPLFYDMAVFASDIFSKHTGLVINEDEMSFLAFYFGSYLENDVLGLDKIPCTLLYVDYHELQSLALDRIERAFGDDLAIMEVLPVSGASPARIHGEIVISPLPVTIPESSQLVIVSPILTDADMKSIKRAVSVAQSKRQEQRIVNLIQKTLRPDLFKRNFYRPSRESMVHALVDDAAEKGLCDETLYSEVMRRETLSSTAFGNQVAVPHTMAPVAYCSFLSMVINDKPMTWGDQRVNIVLLIGTSESDTNPFKILFDDLLCILSDPTNATQLIRTADYSDFVEQLGTMIVNQKASSMT